MTQYSKESGFSAYCTLHPPVIFNSLMMLNAEVRSIWYSLSPSVSEGALHGISGMHTNRIDILHVTYGDAVSVRITHYFVLDLLSILRYSAQPVPHRHGLRRKPLLKISTSSCSLWAIPPPELPRGYNAGRSTTGYPMVLVNLIPSSTVFQQPGCCTGLTDALHQVFELLTSFGVTEW